MRAIRTLLKIVKTDREKNWHTGSGLCSITRQCHYDGLMTDEEHQKVMDLLHKHKPKNAIAGAHWFSHDGIERSKFLDKLIKKYSRKKSK